MNIQQISFGFIEFFLTIFISFVLIFFCYRLLLALTPKFDEEEQLKRKNVSVGLVLGGILLGEAIIVKQAIYPVMAVVQLFILGEDRSFFSFIKTLGLSIGHVLMAGILAVVSMLFCFWLFNLLTPRIDQYEEIKQNNMAVAVFMALFIVGICLLLSTGVSGLIKALIPFPDIGSIPLR
jgi:putative membrane protein